MFTEIMQHIKNYFPAGKTYTNQYKITSGHVNLPLKEGQYYLIEGSIFNDGVHVYGEDDLEDEQFYGTVSALKPPKAFIDLCEEIIAWQSTKGKTEATGIYTSESFGGYSYSKATTSSGTPAGWKEVFKTRLDVWRKV